MSADPIPPGWVATAQLRWCVDQTPNGCQTRGPHLEQWYDDTLGGGGWFNVPTAVEVVDEVEILDG